MKCGTKLSKYSISGIGNKKISQRKYSTSNEDVEQFIERAKDLSFDDSIFKNLKNGIDKKENDSYERKFYSSNELTPIFKNSKNGIDKKKS